MLTESKCGGCEFWENGSSTDEWGQCELLGTTNGVSSYSNLLAYAIDSDPEGLHKKGNFSAQLMTHRDFSCSESQKKSRKKISNSLRYELLKAANFRCQACGVSASDVQLEIDHIHPLSLGGLDSRSNYQVLCWQCNNGKGARA